MNETIINQEVEVAVQAEPVIESSIYSSGEFRIIIKVDDLASETYLEIKDSTNGEVVTIPSRFLRAMGSLTTPLTNMHKSKSQKQMDAHHPLDLFENLAPIYSLTRDKVIIAGSNANEIGVPLLVWHNETQAHLLSKNGITLPKQVAGWRLGLTGFLDESLGFAAWNDLDGIVRLVEHMGNQQGLSTQLALTVPRKGAKLTAGLALQEYARTYTQPEMRTKDVRKKLIDAGYRNGKKGQIAALTVEVDGKSVVIAVGISKEVNWVTDSRNKEAVESITPIMTQSPNPWLPVNLSGLMDKDGRFAFRNNYALPVWFTLMPQEDWDRLSLGISSVAKIDRGRSWF